MTINTKNINLISTNGDGNANTFNFPFAVQKAGDLLVYKYSSDLVKTPLILDTDFTVSGYDVEGNGVITYPKDSSATKLATGEHLIITTNIFMVQLLQLRNNQNLNYEILEKTLDHIVLLIKQNQTITNKSLTVHETKSFEPPKIVAELNKGEVYIADDNGNLTSFNIDEISSHKDYAYLYKTQTEAFYNKTKLIAQRFIVSSTRPTNPIKDTLWNSTVNNTIEWWNGNEWIPFKNDEIEKEIHKLSDYNEFQNVTYVPYGETPPSGAKEIGDAGEWLDRNDFSIQWDKIGWGMTRDPKVQEVITRIDKTNINGNLIGNIDYHSDNIDLTGLSHITFKVDPAGKIATTGGSPALAISLNAEDDVSTVNGAYLMAKTSNGWKWERTLMGVLQDISGSLHRYSFKDLATEFALVPYKVSDASNIKIVIKKIISYGKKQDGGVNEFFVLPHPEQNQNKRFCVFPDGASNRKETDDIAYNSFAFSKDESKFGQLVTDGTTPYKEVVGNGAMIQKYDDEVLDGVESKTVNTGTTSASEGFFSGYVENPLERIYLSGTSKVIKAYLYKYSNSSLGVDKRIVVEANTQASVGANNNDISELFETNDTAVPSNWQAYINIKFMYQKKVNNVWVSDMAGKVVRAFKMATMYDLGSDGRPDKVSLGTSPAVQKNSGSTDVDTGYYTIPNITTNALKGFDKFTFAKQDEHGHDVIGATTYTHRPDDYSKIPLQENDWLYLNLWTASRKPSSSSPMYDRMTFGHRLAIEFEKVNITTVDFWLFDEGLKGKISVVGLRDVDSRLFIPGANYLPEFVQGNKNPSPKGRIKSTSNLTAGKEISTHCSKEARIYTPTDDTVVVNVDTQDFSTNKYGAISVPIKCTNEITFTSVNMFKNGKVNEIITKINNEYVVVLYGNLKKNTNNRIAFTITGRTNATRIIVGTPKYNQVADAEGVLDTENLPTLAYEELVDFDKSGINSNTESINFLKEHALIINHKNYKENGNRTDKFDRGDGGAGTVTIGATRPVSMLGFGISGSLQGLSDLRAYKNPYSDFHPVDLYLQWTIPGSASTDKGKYFGFEIRHDKEPIDIFIHMVRANAGENDFYDIHQKTIGEHSTYITAFARDSDLVNLNLEIVVRFPNGNYTLSGLYVSKLYYIENVKTTDILQKKYPIFKGDNKVGNLLYENSWNSTTGVLDLKRLDSI